MTARKPAGKIEQWATSPVGATISRLSTLAIPVLIAALAWYYVNATEDTKRLLETLQLSTQANLQAITTLQVQVFERTGDRFTATQAALIHDAQNARMTRLEGDIGELRVDVDELTDRYQQLRSAF